MNDFLYLLIGFVVAPAIFDLFFGHPKDFFNGIPGGILGWLLS